MKRIYINHPIDELERLVDSPEFGVDALNQIVYELTQRQTVRARTLHQKAIRRRDRLRAEALERGESVRYSTLELALDDETRRPAEDRHETTSSAKQPKRSAAEEAAEKARLRKLYDRLREKLLDMKLSNPMLSYKHRATSKRQLQIVDEVPEEVYRALAAEGISLDVAHLPEPEGIPEDEQTEEFRAELEHGKVSDLEYLTAVAALETAGRDDEFALAQLETDLRNRLRDKLGMPKRPSRKTISPTEHAKSLGIDPQIELRPKAEKGDHQDRKLQTLKWPDSLISILDKVQSDAVLSEQEMGLSTLFLVFGFLEWADSKDSSKRLFAPLLLLPVKLTERKTGKGKIIYSLAATSEQADGNLSLAKKLESMNLVLPAYDPAEGAKTPVEDYFNQVNEVVAEQAGWKVRRWLTLGHFAFGRFAMYADLDPAKWKQSPVENPLVNAVLRGTEVSGDGGTGLSAPPDDYDVDDETVETVAPYLVRDADASQYSAVIDVMKGKNLVIQGPPGTGKSQTIANIIANALAKKKKVLFLAEKMAALKVVKRRLDEDGLGHFCLELHSDKSSAKQVIQSLRERHKLGYIMKSGSTTSDVMWHQARRDIREYLEALHADTDVGKPFDQFWKAIKTRADLGEAVGRFRKTTMPASAYTSNAAFEGIRDRLSQYASMKAVFETSFGPVEQSVWSGKLVAENLNPGIAYPLLDELANLGQQVERLKDALAAAAPFGIGTVQQLRESPDLRMLADLPLADEQLIAFLASFDPEMVNFAIAAADELDRTAASLVMPTGFDAADSQQRETVEQVTSHLSDAELDETPSQTFARVRMALKQVDSVGAAAKAIGQQLPLLGLTQTFPVAGSTVLWVLGRVLLKVPRGLRRLVLQAPPGTAALLEPIVLEWNALRTAETAWRSRFTSASERWPGIDALLAAADIREKSGLGGLFAGFGASKKTIMDVNASLGVPATVKLTSADYRDLAEHTRQLGAFTNNSQYRALFAEHWVGLDTPIEDFRIAVSLMEKTLDLVAGAPGGPELLRQISVLGPDFVQPLVSSQSALALWAELSDEVRKLAGSASFETIDQHLAIVALSARRVSQCQGLDHLSSLASSWRELADVLLQSGKHRDAQVRLASIGSTALQQVAKDRRLDAQAAQVWIIAVAGIAADAMIIERLRSVGGRVFLSGYLQTQATARENLAAAEDSIQQLRSEFGFVGSSIENPEPVLATINTLTGRRDELQQFLGLHCARANCVADGLEPFLGAAEQLAVPASTFPALFSGLIAVQRAEQLRRQDPVLSKATGAQLGGLRQQFRQRDGLRKEADKKSVMGAVIGGRALPGSNYGSKKTWTESELLQLEFGKERTSVRVLQLIKQAGRSIQEMKPCFMMSPLSLAKFVPAGPLGFDLLVIDEASQMRPEDALGGLLRAEQVVVVGDPKQLPPTDFFQRSGDGTPIDEDGVPLDDDDESILEACEKTFRQSRLLRWHYRSRCESLIAFSNKHIYAPEGRQLITFPAASPGAFSIDCVRIAGGYDQQRNPQEAQRIAEDAVLFMQHHAETKEPPTIGIVAMNSKQAELISEQIKLLARGDDLVERYQTIVAKRGEEFFVKNLENVQGDERDYILISLTYGPKSGERAVPQRFGPITGKQGHRRLNVLFTRARVRVGLYTSMDANDVKPGDTSSRGVHMLKQYLAYAESGGRNAGTKTDRAPDSDFEVHVAERLRALGFEVEYQVGVSGYRIDLAVLHPDKPGQYLAGIECDGAQYHSSKSARDRDRLRQDLLEGLGWSILRVWSTDWFDNPDRQTELLAGQLQRLQKSNLSTSATYAFSTNYERSTEQEFRNAPDSTDTTVIPQQYEKAVDDGSDAETDTVNVSEPIEHVTTGEAVTVAMGALDSNSVPVWQAEKLTQAEARQVLAAFRDQVISTAITPWEPERSILRSSMIETFVEQRLIDEGDWFLKVPQFQRRGTNPMEKVRFLSEICEIVSRIAY